MARIALDASYIFGAYPTGSATYSRRLIESVAEVNTKHELLVAYRFSRFRLRREFLQPAGTAVRLVTCWLPRQVDLFHSLAQRPPSFRFRREVVTIHDIFPITSGDYATADYRERFSRLLREAMVRSACILTGSEATARLMEAHCGVARGRIRVIPYGVDIPRRVMPPEARVRERARLVGDGNYMLLSVGMIETRKNLVNGLRALERLPARFHLAHAGGNGHGSEAFHEYIREQGLEERVHLLGYVPSETLEMLYQTASVLLFPSLEEGFGFPVLEGMAHGLPVVTSNTSSMPELGGGAALYADPREPDEIADRALRAAEDETLRRDLIARGLERAREFTWERTAKETLRAYEDVL